MNYATLIALLAAMSFSLPILLKVEQHFGVGRNAGILFSLAFVVFIWVWLYLRWNAEGNNETTEGLLPHEPYLPEVFFKDGVFHGETYKNEGKYQEALSVYELYRIVLKRQGQDTEHCNSEIEEIERLLADAEKHTESKE